MHKGLGHWCSGNWRTNFAYRLWYMTMIINININIIIIIIIIILLLLLLLLSLLLSAAPQQGQLIMLLDLCVCVYVCIIKYCEHLQNYWTNLHQTGTQCLVLCNRKMISFGGAQQINMAAKQSWPYFETNK